MTSTYAVQSPEDAVNDALTRIGYPQRITNMFEGSKASNAALDLYSQTRDSLLRENDWGFAKRDVALTLLKRAPDGGYVGGMPWSSAYPALNWVYEYGYPADCLRVRAVKLTPIFVPNFSPRTNSFAIENDNSFTPPQRVILCNVPNAILTYVGQVVDLTTWESDAIEALIAALARRLGPVLAGMDAAKLEAEDEVRASMMAEGEQG